MTAARSAHRSLAGARRVLVRGSGDVGSAVAHALFGAGYLAVLHDEPRAAHPRRSMAYADALYERKAALDGVWAKAARDESDLLAMLDCGRAIAISILSIERLVELLRPQVLVDARMRKRAVPEPQRHLAPLTIGLGVGFVAGQQVDLLVETQWGERLGAVLRTGTTAPLGGEPREFAGHARRRCVYAPCAGTVRTSRRIGERVRRGEPVASVGEHAILAPLDGAIRGLPHDGAEIAAQGKVLEIDPRDTPSLTGLGERPRRIAEGVLAAIGGCRSPD